MSKFASYADHPHPWRGNDALVFPGSPPPLHDRFSEVFSTQHARFLQRPDRPARTLPDDSTEDRPMIRTPFAALVLLITVTATPAVFGRGDSAEVVVAAEVAGLVGVVEGASTAVAVVFRVEEAVSTAVEPHVRGGVLLRSAILRGAERVPQHGQILVVVPARSTSRWFGDSTGARPGAGVQPGTRPGVGGQPARVRVWGAKDYIPVLVPEPGLGRGTGRQPFRELDRGLAPVRNRNWFRDGIGSGTGIGAGAGVRPGAGQGIAAIPGLSSRPGVSQLPAALPGLGNRTTGFGEGFANRPQTLEGRRSDLQSRVTGGREDWQQHREGCRGAGRTFATNTARIGRISPTTTSTTTVTGTTTAGMAIGTRGLAGVICGTTTRSPRRWG